MGTYARLLVTHMIWTLAPTIHILAGISMHAMPAIGHTHTHSRHKHTGVCNGRGGTAGLCARFGGWVWLEALGVGCDVSITVHVTGLCSCVALTVIAMAHYIYTYSGGIYIELNI